MLFVNKMNKVKKEERRIEKRLLKKKMKERKEKNKIRLEKKTKRN